MHSCHNDTNLGCSACHRTCHSDCSNSVCPLDPCEFCASFRVITPPNSNVCQQVQLCEGCHSCGERECWTCNTACSNQQGGASGSANNATSSSQRPLCTRLLHVCGPSAPGGGCVNCGRCCHVDNTDPRCEFFSRARGSLTWDVTPAQMRDTEAGTMGHRTSLLASGVGIPGSYCLGRSQSAG